MESMGAFTSGESSLGEPFMWRVLHLNADDSIGTALAGCWTRIPWTRVVGPTTTSSTE